MRMRLLVLLAVFPCILGPPVDKNAKPGPQQNETLEDWNLGLEYNKYLQEVVQVLESDPDFRKKLEGAKVDEIRDGTIARELEFLNHGIRTKLDEIKRQELERLRHLQLKQVEMSQGLDRKHIKIPQHIELKHKTFEVGDLQKLIKQTTNDLEEADKKRREEFKRYEMEKKFEKEQRLNAINDTQERKVVQEEMEKMQAKHKSHEKMNHPMTKDQLEEVWEEQDHMEAKDWDPKTFFAMHDLDGNGQWDENEVRILFKKELDKAYDPNNPEDDMKEREEEMERMREHVFKESDKDKNRMISFQEFLAETERDEFEKDPGWDAIDDEELYTDEEFQRFEKEREEQIQRLIDAGQMPPGGYPYPNIPGMPPVGYNNGGFGYAPLPGGPMPSLDRNGIPMHGSVPGQPAHPQFAPGQLPPQYQQQPQFAGQQPPQYQQQPQFAGQPPQFAGQPPQFAGQPPQFAGQPQQQPQFAGSSQQQFAGQPPVNQAGQQQPAQRGQAAAASAAQRAAEVGGQAAAAAQLDAAAGKPVGQSP